MIEPAEKGSRYFRSDIERWKQRIVDDPHMRKSGEAFRFDPTPADLQDFKTPATVTAHVNPAETTATMVFQFFCGISISFPIDCHPAMKDHMRAAREDRYRATGMGSSFGSAFNRTTTKGPYNDGSD